MGTRGAVFMDPSATKPYLFHMALLSMVRKADPEVCPTSRKEEMLECRLVGVKPARRRRDRSSVRSSIFCFSRAGTDFPLRPNGWPWRHRAEGTRPRLSGRADRPRDGPRTQEEPLPTASRNARGSSAGDSTTRKRNWPPPAPSIPTRPAAATARRWRRWRRSSASSANSPPAARTPWPSCSGSRT